MNLSNTVMWETLHNNAGWDCVRTLTSLEIWKTQKSTSWRTLCILGSHTFVPISWICEKQTSVSQSSTESEIISLDARLRLDGISALDLWALIVAILGNTYQNNQERGDLCPNQREVRSTPHTNQKQKQSH